MSWLDDRKKGLGGTDVSAILGLNEYRNAFDVWAEKTDRVGSIEDNEAMKRGRLLEKTIVEYIFKCGGSRKNTDRKIKNLLVIYF